MAIALLSTGWAITHATSSLLLLILVLAYIACFAFSVGPVTWILLSEIFPSHLRAEAMAISTAALWIANFVVSQTFPMLSQSPAVIAHFGRGFPFYIYALFCFIEVGWSRSSSRRLVTAHWRKSRAGGVPRHHDDASPITPHAAKQESVAIRCNASPLGYAQPYLTGILEPHRHFQNNRIKTEESHMAAHSQTVRPQPAKPDYNLTGINASAAVEMGLAEADWYQCAVPRATLRSLLERRDGPPFAIHCCGWSHPRRWTCRVALVGFLVVHPPLSDLQRPLCFHLRLPLA